MRISPLFVVLVACPKPDTEGADTGPACELTFFLDADGDGHGDPNTAGETACAPDTATGFTASAADDCDDADFDVTWATTCPAVFVNSCEGSVTQFSIGTTDYLLVGPSAADPSKASCVVLPTAVDGLCAMWSPEAKPLALDDDGEFAAVKSHVQADYHAFWIDAVRVDGAWVWADSGMPFSSLGGWCDAVDEPPADPAATHLGLLTRRLADDGARVTCLGTPDQLWGRYYQEFATLSDRDGDGLEDHLDPDPDAFDTDQDGLGDGREVEVLGTDPEVNDGFPLRVESPPTVAFDTAHAFLACERAQ